MCMKNTLDSHFTRANVEPITHCKILDHGVVHIVFQVIDSHRKEYGLTWDCKIMYYKLGPHLQYIFKPQFHIEGEFIWNCAQLEKVVDGTKCYLQQQQKIMT